ncbi:MAG: hypothetical protein J4F29_10395 [Candidatus Latescibacteria bacterium]|nr:hypothetical protein [Candidatus Latescibacterota bacterium]
MASRICIILTCLIAFAGCYTQLRAPRVHREQPAESPVSPSENSVQRFEYYYHNYYNPSPLPFYGSYNPYRPYRPYRRYPVWNRHRLIWEYSCWASVHDPWWRGWSPRILVPHIVYAPTPAVRPQIAREQVNPRPHIRYTGVRGAPASASTVRSGSTTTESTPTTQQPEKPRSTKTQSAEKSEKKEEKSETREEKRSTKRRRGGMR